MVFCVAGHVSLYLDKDGSKVMHQGRSGSDVCGNFFSVIRYANSNPTMQQAREGASEVFSSVGMEGKSFMHESRANLGKAAVATALELLVPIEGRPTKKHKKG